MTMRHPAAQVHVCDVSKPTSDPTGTLDIRRRFRIATDLRWRKFAKLLRSVIITQDILGLGPEVSTALQITFASLPAEARLRSLQTWTDDMLGRVVLEGSATYLDPMVGKAYRRAVVRAQRLTKSKSVPAGASDAIGLLEHLAMTELQGIMEAASQQIVRAGSAAIINHSSPAVAMRAMNDVIEKIGVVRSRQLVSMIVVKAHGTGTLDQFASAGVKRVGLLAETRPRAKKLTRDAAKPVAPAQGRRGTSPSTIGRIAKAERKVEKALAKTERVEVLTAGDDLVCPECEDISADGPYDIDEARSLIPAHPECRCSFVPEGSELFGVFEFQDEDWSEEDHPRDPDGPDAGQFTSGGGGITVTTTGEKLPQTGGKIGVASPETMKEVREKLGKTPYTEWKDAPVQNVRQIDLLSSQNKYIDPKIVKSYVKQIKAGEKFEPPNVYKVGNKHIIEDGHHRAAAWTQAKPKERMPAHVKDLGK